MANCGVFVCAILGLSRPAATGLALLAAVWVGCALIAGWLADFKGRRFPRYVAAGLLCGPVVMIVVLLLPRPLQVREAERAAQMPGELPPRWKRYIGLK